MSIKTLFASLAIATLALSLTAAEEKKAETKNLADPAMIATAAKAYLANCVTNGVKPPTIGKYRNTLNQLKTFAETDEICRAKKVCRVADLNVTDLDRFRAGRKIAPITSSKELECLKSFFEFCTSREFCPKNVAASIKGPKIVDQNDVVPYTTDEMNAIIDASGRFGQNDYERRRGRAMVLILRHTALRISDVALMRRDRITHTATGWRIFVRTTKNHELVYLLVPDELVNAVNSLPVPRGASKDCPYLFWNNNSKPKSQISEVSETVAAIYKKSGVQDASSHRWRHSIATELLGIGATFEEVADVLGNSPAIVRKHYANWSQQRQNRIDDLIQKVREEAWRR